LKNTIDSNILQFTEYLKSNLNFNISEIKKISQGKNSRVYHLIIEKQNDLIAKIYFQSNNDKRDRLNTERLALEFLWNHGLRNIPKIVHTDKENGFTILLFVKGKKILSSETDVNDINNVIGFLIQLKNLGRLHESLKLPLASEAFFTIKEIEINIEKRLNRLLLIQSDNTESRSLKTMLEKTFIPGFEKIKKWSKQKAIKKSIDYNEPISINERTLSPSDFGFHNALKLCDNKLIFLDFEYFGWDDPAKLINDFILHPAMNISEELKSYFVNEILKRFKINKLFSRVKILYPLFGLKWCIILLNEFLPKEFERRDFSCQYSKEKSKIQATQLVKSEKMFDSIINTYERFPYA